jgi:hypothetical protein
MATADKWQGELYLFGSKLTWAVLNAFIKTLTLTVKKRLLMKSTSG